MPPNPDTHPSLDAPANAASASLSLANVLRPKWTSISLSSIRSKADFIINVVPNLDGDITGIFTGNWISAWQKATTLVDKIFGVAIEEQADIVIASAGGYPKDINLYQSQKTIDNAVYAMKKGGVAIILAACPDIKEPGEFFDWFTHPTAFDMEKAVREKQRWPPTWLFLWGLMYNFWTVMLRSPMRTSLSILSLS